jgi:hypothetical protein
MRVHAVVATAVAVCSLIGIGSSASALVNTGDADAAGAALSLDFVLLPDINTGLVPAVSVSSPPPGTQSQTLVDLSPLQLISGGVASVSATTDVNNLPGSRTADADAAIDDFAMVLSVTPLVTLLGISGDLSSSATVSGDFGALAATGSSSFTAVQITVNNVTFSLDPNYAANTQVYNSGGILIIANEQIVGGDGISLRTLTTNALRVSLTVAGVVTGSVILGQSQAALTAVPEPGTAALLGLGLVALASIRQRRI